MKAPTVQAPSHSRLLLAALALVACGGGSPPAPVDLAQEWVAAAPASQHVDAAALARAYASAQASPGLTSLVVIRNGVLVGEQYSGNTDSNTLHDVRSVTKSVLSMLVGIAIAQGTLAGTGERLSALIHPPVAQVTGPKADITIDNLLTMTSGFAWDESTAAGYNAWALAPNQVDYLLAKPLADKPGTWFTYNTAAVHLLSVGLSEATGLSTIAYADANLFAPLNITSRDWEQDNQGFYDGGAGLMLRSRDLAKIGQLVLQGGSSGRNQIVPAGWIRQMLAVHWTPGGQLASMSHLQYGYLWWLGSAGGHPVQFAWGYRGQYLLLVPDLRLVVVATSTIEDHGLDNQVEAAATMSVILDGVLPAVR